MKHCGIHHNVLLHKMVAQICQRRYFANAYEAACESQESCQQPRLHHWKRWDIRNFTW